jgi:hypothetical protein
MGAVGRSRVVAVSPTFIGIIAEEVLKTIRASWRCVEPADFVSPQK